MNITLNRETDKLILNACGIAPRNPQRQILAHVLLRGNTISATDQDRYFTAEISADIESDGATCLPAQKLAAILRATPGPLRISSDGTICTIKSNSTTYRIPTADPDEFPLAPKVSEFPYLVEAGTLRRALHRTVFATDTESSRYALGGCLFEFGDNELNVVASDGRRLSRVEAEATGPETEQSIIVPKDSVSQLLSFLPDEGEVKIGLGTTLAFQCGGVSFNTLLVGGKFPKWRDVIPSYTDFCEFNVDEWDAALKQVSILIDAESYGVVFDFSDGKVSIKGSSQSNGESEAKVGIKGEIESEVTIDIRFVKQFIETCEGTAEVSINGPDAPVLFRSKSHSYVVMPLAKK